MATHNGMLIEGLGMNAEEFSDFPPVHAQGGTLYSGIADDLAAFELPAGTQRPGYLAEPYYTGAGAASPVAPVVSNLLPAPGLIDHAASLQLDVTDATLERIVLLFNFGSGNYEVAWDGAAFAPKFAFASTRTAIGEGYHFVLKHEDGWVGTFTLLVEAHDAEGSEVYVSYQWSALNVEVDVESPDEETRFKSLTVDTPFNIFPMVLSVEFSNDIIEVIHDGTNFVGRYAGSIRTLRADGGWRYIIVRSVEGWYDDPTFKLAPA